ncbi:hypothetical protein DY000_02021147 [Brassica cretica]|uniref:Uncharacterized protein n=1 Tax=Brassica cretica TaxID=69181 RepID=A0ABQ7EKJ2_BRACR|nr:hypothetical protein DY000_02021147 [Brassica cretica]
MLLAAPIILDLVLLAELSNRIRFKSEEEGKFHFFPFGGHHSQLPHQCTARATGNMGG